ncbi:mandelate racemase/muconate lactonizing enzyme family protein [Cobetia amphilecti]|uniref:mandelate racemase/muconate lactonizing enzyme family protein n=1 Tax=Cobetia amphilecti TaxID=1055104 RepID=UPI001C0809FC|nr:mandelate racemase/muconate lactonizing enzyme family protein [Cobetia amphilecti]MBU3007720.1 mandelate racemase/muconate lactonizing enzyme family protein [Cobetia amphilecti]
MKITNLRTVLVEVPLEKPLITAIHETRSVGCVLIYLETDSGLVGENYIFTLNSARLSVFDSMIKSLAHHVIGQDPHYVERMWDGMWREINPIGHEGITIGAMSALDTACWDLIGKAANQPVYKLFGAYRDSVKTYASSGLWLSQTTDELVEEAREFMSQGFRAMKMRLGKPRMAEDVARVAAVREAIGPDIELLADGNQAFTPSQAIRLGRMLEPYDLGWFEEPVASYDHQGHADVAAALDMPIASGETEYTRHGMQRMIQARSADVLMPDLQRIGGLSEFRRVASLAAGHNVPISTHIFTEQSLSIAGSAPNCLSVEHVSWFSPLYREKIEIVDGLITIPQRPGLGFSFDADAVDRLRVR